MIDAEYIRLREAQRFLREVKNAVLEEVGPGKPGEVRRKAGELIDSYIAARKSTNPAMRNLAAMFEARIRERMGPPPDYEAEEAYAYLERRL